MTEQTVKVTVRARVADRGAEYMMQLSVLQSCLILSISVNILGVLDKLQ